jgi:hypothetical protein
VVGAEFAGVDFGLPGFEPFLDGGGEVVVRQGCLAGVDEGDEPDAGLVGCLQVGWVSVR